MTIERVPAPPQDDNEVQLRTAVKSGDEAEVQRLLALGVDVNTSDRDWQTPLHLVTTASIARLLIEKGAKVNDKAKEAKRPLHCAQTPDIALVLIESGADINAKDSYDWTPLHHAVSNGSVELVQLLLSKGAKMDERNNAGRSPWHLSAFKSPELVQLFVDHGVDVNMKTTISDGEKTALFFAETSEIAAILLVNGADVNVKTSTKSETALHLVDKAGVAEVLIEKGADVNAVTDYVNGSNTPLHYAVDNNRLSIVKVLCANHANRKALTASGESALSIAETNGYDDIVDYLKSI